MTGYDFTGHGRSPRAGELTLESLAAELALVIESQTASGRAHLVGHSMGTLIVQQLASPAPDLVQEVVLLGPVREQAQAGEGRHPGTRRPRPREGHGRRSRHGRQRRHRRPRSNREPARSGPSSASCSSARTRKPTPQACEALAAATNPDLTTIRSKVLLLTGSEDKVSTPASNETMAAELGSAELLVAPGTGHWTVPEAPDFVTAAVLDFLTSTTLTPATKKTCACSNASPGCQSRRQQTITMQIRKAP